MIAANPRQKAAMHKMHKRNVAATGRSKSVRFSFGSLCRISGRAASGASFCTQAFVSPTGNMRMLPSESDRNP